MYAAFKIQQEVKASLGLKKVVLSINKDYKPNGPKSYVKALRKYRINPTLPGPYKIEKRPRQQDMLKASPQLLSADEDGMFVYVLVKENADGGTGKVTADDQQTDLEYLCDVEIGTPPQKVSLDFDSGSADLWVFSTALPDSTQAGHNVYDPAKSSTYVPLNDMYWEIQYGDGTSASGDVGTDVVSFGGLSIQNQAVELAQDLSWEFAGGPGDGLLGLAFSSINTVTKGYVPMPQKSPMDNLIEAGTLPRDTQVFTCALYSTRDANMESFYTFGYVDQDLVAAAKQDIAWASVDSSGGFWMFASETATVNGTQIQLDGNTAIADTGTSLCLVSDSVCKALYDAIPGAEYDSSVQGYLIPSSITIDQLPAFSIAVGSTEFVIQKEYLIYGDVNNGFYFGGIQSRGGNPFDILGDVFLKSIYAIFDQGNVRFGAVPKIQEEQNLHGERSQQN